jgi:hypothetical protein
MTFRALRGAVSAAAAAAAVAGCAVGPPLEQRLLPFIGQSEGNLVAVLGVPERTYEVEGRKFLTFEDRRSYIVAGDPFLYRGYSYGYGRRFGYGPYFAPPGYVVRTCEITFALRGGRVESFSFRGDGCR